MLPKNRQMTSAGMQSDRDGTPRHGQVVERLRVFMVCVIAAVVPLIGVRTAPAQPTPGGTDPKADPAPKTQAAQPASTAGLRVLTLAMPCAKGRLTRLPSKFDIAAAATIDFCW